MKLVLPGRLIVPGKPEGQTEFEVKGATLGEMIEGLETTYPFLFAYISRCMRKDDVVTLRKKMESEEVKATYRHLNIPLPVVDDETLRHLIKSRPFTVITFHINDERMSLTDGLETQLQPDDEIQLVPTTSLPGYN